MKFLSDREVIRHILREQKRYIPWIGAGFSVEAGVKSAWQICEDIKQSLIVSQRMEHLNEGARKVWADENLDWSDPSLRYMSCIQNAYPNEATRNEFFHKVLLDTQPSLSHYSLALLMSAGYLKSTCLTTNFDHLIENAFTQQDIGGIQPIRTEDECEYLQDGDNRYYVVKLHGDIDTQNVMNTRKETEHLTENMVNMVRNLAYNSGLLVLGTSGNEQSIWSLFQELVSRSPNKERIWSFGVFWGVYMGMQRPDLPENELNKLLEEMLPRRIRETEINKAIKNVIGDSPNELFCFFPVWGAGKFMFDLIEATGNKDVISKASRYLDHEMRLRYIYSNAGLNENAIQEHLQKLRKQREKIENARSGGHPEPDTILKAHNSNYNVEVQIMYGDITSRALMSYEAFQHKRRAIVSPEDTCISAGGGVAYGLLLKAGQKTLLNELAKFTPIPQNEVAVTSAGNLPVHYIIHAATLKIEADATYSVDRHNVQSTMEAILNKLDALDIDVVWTPLMASGVASLKAIDSFEAILSAIWNYSKLRSNAERAVTIIIVIYQEREFPRHLVYESFNNILGTTFERVSV